MCVSLCSQQMLASQRPGARLLNRHLEKEVAVRQQQGWDKDMHTIMYILVDK